MSKNNNVNPGQYKVGGRERPNVTATERMKAARAEGGVRGSKGARKTSNRPSR